MSRCSYWLDSISGMGVCSSSELTIAELGKARDLSLSVNRVEESTAHQEKRVWYLLHTFHECPAFIAGSTYHTHTEIRGYSQSRFLPQRAFTVKRHSEEAYDTAELESTLLSSGPEQLCKLPYPADLCVVNT
jgi:hypothetical protein